MNKNLLVGPRPRRDFLKDTLKATKKPCLYKITNQVVEGF